MDIITIIHMTLLYLLFGFLTNLVVTALKMEREHTYIEPLNNNSIGYTLLFPLFWLKGVLFVLFWLVGKLFSSLFGALKEFAKPF